MTSQDVLSPLALDFLWESLGLGELPYPLEVRSHGTTMDERTHLRHQYRPPRDSYLADGLALLATAERSIDVVFLPVADAPPVKALIGATGATAVLATQDDRGLWLRRIPVGALASTAVALLPAAPRGSERSVTLPAEQVAAIGSRPAPRRPVTDADLLARLFEQERTAAGQFGVNGRDRVSVRRRAPALSWFDTESGRYLTYTKRGHDGHDWVTVSPADAPTLRHRLGELLASVG